MLTVESPVMSAPKVTPDIQKLQDKKNLRNMKSAVLVSLSVM